MYTRTHTHVHGCMCTCRGFWHKADDSLPAKIQLNLGNEFRVHGSGFGALWSGRLFTHGCSTDFSHLKA